MAKVIRRKRVDMRRVAAALKGPSKVKVGLPAGEAPGDVVEYAHYNEFGTERIPERPFIRTTMREQGGKYMRGLKSEAKQILRGQTSMSGTLNRLGMVAAGDIQDTIGSNVPPPNAPSTIAQKGSSGTLIETGRMRQSMTWKVDD